MSQNYNVREIQFEAELESRKYNDLSYEQLAVTINEKTVYELTAYPDTYTAYAGEKVKIELRSSEYESRPFYICDADTGKVLSDPSLPGDGGYCAIYVTSDVATTKTYNLIYNDAYGNPYDTGTITSNVETVTVTWKPKPYITISAESTNVSYGDTVPITYETNISAAEWAVYINGKEISQVTSSMSSEGTYTGTYDYTCDTAGTVTIQIAYPDGSTDVKSNILTLNVGKKDTVITASTDKSVYLVGDTITITGYLKTTNGTPISNAEVTWGNKNFVTDSTGKFSYTETAKNVQLIGFTIIYAGDDYYNATTGGVNFTVSE